MLEQQKADYLIQMPKRLVISKNAYSFLQKGESVVIDAIGVTENEKFIFDIARGKIDVRKCTFQDRYERTIKLLRLDITANGFHYNPDGTRIDGSHIHIYKEGFGDQYAYALPYKNIKTLNHLPSLFGEFMEFCSVENIPYIEWRLDENE